MKRANMTKATKVTDPKPVDCVVDIRDAWHALYSLGDKAISDMRAAAEAGNMTAVRDASKTFELARAAMQKIRPVEDLAFLARKFKKGRKIGAGGPIREAIKLLLKKSPAMKNPELLSQIGAKPPRGWTYFDNRQGKYFEGPAIGDHMVKGRFYTVCGEERKKIKR